MMFLFKTIIITTLVIFTFLTLWEPLGRLPSGEEQKQFKKRTRFFYDGKFHTEDPLILFDKKAKSDFSKDAEKVPKSSIPVNKLSSIESADVNKLKFIWIGHSTSLLQMHGLNIFIAPVLSNYASPVQGLGGKRMSEVPITADKMPEIDILLLSHDHYDHLDYKTIKDMDAKVKQYVVPLGVDSHLQRWGVDEKKIIIMSWFESINIKGLEITSTPGRHYSGRLPWKRNKTLWCGYYLKDNKHSVYYTGDTGYGDFFKDISKRFGRMDLVIIENGQYDNKWPDCHMKPEESIEAAKILKADYYIPIHWAGFPLAYHSWYDPIKRFTEDAEKADIKVATPLIGEVVDYENIDKYKNKWWLDVK